MTIAEIKELAMFQIGNDAEDLADYIPYVDAYLYEGLDLLVYACKREHPAKTDAPDDVLPEWAHKALADYVTWCLYRNGNANKQQRGFQFLSSFRDVQSKLNEQSASRARTFYNIPR